MAPANQQPPPPRPDFIPERPNLEMSLKPHQLGLDTSNPGMLQQDIGTLTTAAAGAGAGGGAARAAAASAAPPSSSSSPSFADAVNVGTVELAQFLQQLRQLDDADHEGKARIANGLLDVIPEEPDSINCLGTSGPGVVGGGVQCTEDSMGRIRNKRRKRGGCGRASPSASSGLQSLGQLRQVQESLSEADEVVMRLSSLDLKLYDVVRASRPRAAKRALVTTETFDAIEEALRLIMQGRPFLWGKYTRAAGELGLAFVSTTAEAETSAGARPVALNPDDLKGGNHPVIERFFQRTVMLMKSLRIEASLLLMVDESSLHDHDLFEGMTVVVHGLIISVGSYYAAVQNLN